VFVADFANNRVLSWPGLTGYVNGQQADLVLGQGGFAAALPNRGGLAGPNTLNQPTGVAVDGAGNVYVADRLNSRVLVFSGTLSSPNGVAVDGAGGVYVADSANNRVLIYSGTISDGMNASLVLGQANLSSGASNRGGAVGPDTLSSPFSVAVDLTGLVYVADSSNNRGLAYAAPLSTGMNAGLVFGQPNFNSNSA